MEIHKQLIQCFAKPLPGEKAQYLMAPSHRADEIRESPPGSDAIKSSVLICFYQKQNISYIPFIVRTNDGGVHSGQIAFPGGRWESSDRSLFHTAVREAREEIGIVTERVKYCGKLTDLYIPPSNYIVSPYVATYEADPHFKPDPSEVAEVLEIPFDFFLSENAIQERELIVREQFRIITPCFNYKGHIIWGATAMILHELIIQWKTTV